MTDYTSLLRELAVPRLVGTANHDTVRGILKRELKARGFSVEEHAFSGRPSRALFGSPRSIQGVNVIARPGGGSARPAVWLVAHYDSKGQPVSMAVRLAGFVALAVGLLTSFAVPWVAVALIVIGAVIISRNRVTDGSPGAVDNASAVLTIFMTIDQLKKHHVGVIFPDAEEFGLVGARALARERPDLLVGSAVINLDGIDDVGPPIAFLHTPGQVGRRIAQSLSAWRARWLPVVVDGLSLRTAAAECVTILKGNVQTMRIVHTPYDTAERLSLAGARQVAEGLARALRKA